MPGGLTEAICLPLAEWYTQAYRMLPWREEISPYRIWISEVMLQQTRVEAVKPFFFRFITAFPDVFALAAAQEEACLKAWEGLGYYSRVRNLHRAAEILVNRYDGMLPASYEQLLQLPGIGEYTAGAIASIAFQIPVPAVDGNVLRIAARLEDSFQPVKDAAFRRFVREKLKNIIPDEAPGDFNQALMELGATVCLPNGVPLCSQCPLSQECLAYKNGNSAVLPIQKPKNARRVEEKTVLLVCCDGRFALRKRPDTGLLAGMWELPMLDGHCSVQALRRYAKQQHWKVLQLMKTIKAKHVFSHIEWHMIGYFLELSQPPDNLEFVTWEQLQRDHALPSAFRAYKNVMRELS